MAEAKQGDIVRVHYRGELEDGTVFDSSQEGEPLEFVIGEGAVIPGFEKAVVGMNPGDERTQRIPADEAYGPHHEELVLTLEREAVDADFDVSLGQRLEMMDGQGRALEVTVVEVTDDQVTLDANHLLAGRDLIFHIELVDVESQAA